MLDTRLLFLTIIFVWYQNGEEQVHGISSCRNTCKQGAVLISDWHETCIFQDSLSKHSDHKGKLITVLQFYESLV